MKQITKEIKDYLHLYLGCQVKGNEGSMIYTLANVHKSGEGCVLLDSIGNVCIIEGNKFKLLLRKLSSMTEEEAKEYLSFKYNAKKVSVTEKVKNGFWFDLGTEWGEIVVKDKFIFEGQIKDGSYPEQFHYLLSKGFDLFGLIEGGLALDKDNL